MPCASSCKRVKSGLTSFKLSSPATTTADTSHSRALPAVQTWRPTRYQVAVGNIEIKSPCTINIKTKQRQIFPQ